SRPFSRSASQRARLHPFHIHARIFEHRQLQPAQQQSRRPRNQLAVFRSRHRIDTCAHAEQPTACPHLDRSPFALHERHTEPFRQRSLHVRFAHLSFHTHRTPMLVHARARQPQRPLFHAFRAHIQLLHALRFLQQRHRLPAAHPQPPRSHSHFVGIPPQQLHRRPRLHLHAFHRPVLLDLPPHDPRGDPRPERLREHHHRHDHPHNPAGDPHHPPPPSARSHHLSFALPRRPRPVCTSLEPPARARSSVGQSTSFTPRGSPVRVGPRPSHFRR